MSATWLRLGTMPSALTGASMWRPQVTVKSRAIFDSIFGAAAHFLSDGHDLASAPVDELRDAATMCGCVHGVVDVDESGVLTQFQAMAGVEALAGR